MLFAFFCLKFAMAEDLLDLNWVVVNDTVMGGVSSSFIERKEDGVLFTGTVSRENNGGFASIRLQSSVNLIGSDGFELHTTGDDLQYQLVVWMGYGPRLYYKYDFQPSEEIQNISFSDFIPVSYGRQVQAPPLKRQLSNARSVGILIGDGQEGDFSLHIHHVSIIESTDDESQDQATEISPEIKISLQRAIQRGVPAYNKGDHQVCAAIYQTVLEDILLLKQSDLSNAQIQQIKIALEDSSELTPDKAAWTYRYVMDSLLR